MPYAARLALGPDHRPSSLGSRSSWIFLLLFASNLYFDAAFQEFLLSLPAWLEHPLKFADFVLYLVFNLT